MVGCFPDMPKYVRVFSQNITDKTHLHFAHGVHKIDSNGRLVPCRLVPFFLHTPCLVFASNTKIAERIEISDNFQL